MRPYSDSLLFTHITNKENRHNIGSKHRIIRPSISVPGEQIGTSQNKLNQKRTDSLKQTHAHTMSTYYINSTL